MPKYKTAQTYDVQSSTGYNYGRFTSITQARKKACQMAYNSIGDKNDTKIVMNPAILPDGYYRPAVTLVTVTCEMFIRPKYDYKYFGKEAIIKNGKITGQYKYYLINNKTGAIDLTDSSFKMYFDGKIRSGVWNRPKRM